MSDLAIPPPALLQTGWFPFILNFYWKAFGVASRFAGVRLTSWYRTPERNRLEGGSPESQHLFGIAWDVQVPLGSIASFVHLAENAGLSAVREKRHVHLQLFPAGVLARAGITFPR